MAKITGFFSEEELDSVGINGPGAGACDKCGLSTGCKTPMMGYTGKGKKEILIIAEAPSEADDKSGAPMMGETGLWFKDKLKAKGIDLDNDCWKTNAIGCHTTKPTKAHIKHCHTRVMKTIRELKPRYIWLMGGDAITSMYGDRESNCSPERWRGLCIPNIELNVWIMPMYHPAYAIRNEKDDHFQAVFDKDLSFAIRCSKFPEYPEPISFKGVKILKSYKDVTDALMKVLEGEPEKLAFDYETTGLKPYRKDHRIATISFSYEYEKAYSFPYEYTGHFTDAQIKTIGDLWADIMENDRIKKIIHNQKFEDMWTREIIQCDIKNKWWCTMNTAHILDNRKEFTGLKFQGLIRWGIPDYDSSISKYLKTDNSTPFNKVMEAPLNDLLLYGGIDSMLTFMLQEEQEDALSDLPGQKKARIFNVQGLNALCDLQENGIPCSMDYYKEQDILIGAKITTMKESLHSMPEAQKFLREKGRPINFASSPDLAELFFKILKLPEGKKTPGGAPCVDASVLADLNTPIAKEITAISKLEKIKGTYLGQFLREIEEDGKLHPFFDLHNVQTYRGSSNSPNFQNIPVRDAMAMNATRGGIIPTKGNRLVDWDYGAMEVKIIACYTQDPVLVNYCSDPTTDMHRDQAMELFAFNKKEWEAMDKKQAKNIRFHAKNGMVFALFYGSYYKSIAKTLYFILKELKTGEITLFEHLRNKGVIRSLSTAMDDFENHVKQVEKKFWFRFKGVKAWQERMFKSYLEKGYIDQMFGFRCGGWLSRNDICNYPIQGTAFHCLVWSLIHLGDRMLDERMKSKLIGQIHDCCLGDIRPDEQDAWCHASFQIATQEIRKEFPWIIVPLEIEFEQSETDRPWSEKREFHPSYM